MQSKTESTIRKFTTLKYTIYKGKIKKISSITTCKMEFTNGFIFGPTFTYYILEFEKGDGVVISATEPELFEEHELEAVKLLYVK